MNVPKSLIFSVIFSMLILSCGPKVMVPPKVDLTQFGSIGLIRFASTNKGTLPDYVTQKFLETVNDAQAKARIIELGSLDRVLDSVNSDELNPAALQAIGKRYNINAVFTGNLEISKVKPKIRIASIISSMGVRAQVDALLTAKLLETSSGVTLWTASAKDSKTVAHVTVFPGGGFHFDARDPEEAYGEIVKSLIRKVTVNLRTTYQRM